MKSIVKEFLTDRGIRRMLWVALILSCLWATWDRLTSYVDDMAIYLRVSIKAPQSGSGTVFYDIGKSYNWMDVSSAFIPGDGRFQEVRFRLPILKTIFHLRFDPPSVGEGELAINRVEVIDHHGRLLQNFDLSRLKPLNQIRQFSFQDGEVRFRIDEPGNDPYLDLGLDRPISTGRWQFIRMLLSATLLEGVGIFLIGLLLIFVWSRFDDKTVGTLAILAIVAAGWSLHQEIKEAQRGSVTSYFNVSMMSDVRGTAKLYYDQGRGINEADLYELEVLPGGSIHAGDNFRDYRFKIPGRFFQLRFDPLDGRGTVTIRGIEITDQRGKVLHAVLFEALKPNADIQTFERRGTELVIVVSKPTADPQIEILKADLLSPDPSKTFPWLMFLRGLLLKWAVIGACLLVAITIRRRYSEPLCRFLDGPFFQQRMHLIYLGCTMALILAMSVVSHPQGNPDEMGHATCAGYYVDHWLPSAVDDEAVLKTLSGYGVSYLFRTEIVYLLAGKTAVLLSHLINNTYFSLRLFNVFLFGLLVAMAIHRTRNPLLFVLGLVATPQVWYIFSYFNGDAFALFISLLIAYQVLYADSPGSRYLSAADPWSRPSGGVWLGLLIGLMLLSKPNYLVFLVFITFILIIRLYFESTPRGTGSPALPMKKGILIAGIALCVYLPPAVYDQYVNGFQKEEKIVQVQEKHAPHEFKASTVKNKPNESYRGLFLRDKGVTFRELFLEWDEWRQMSFKSFFGVYGYMLYYSKSHHFKTLSVLLGGAFLFVLFYSAYRSLSRMDTLILLITLIFCALVIGQSMYFSWTADYEPQGRYLFPIIPMALVGLARLPEMLRQRFVPCFSLCLFLLSLLSFLFTALSYIPKVD